MPRGLKILIAAQIVTLILGLGALVLAYAGEESGRVDARRDTCRLIVGLVRATTIHSPQAQKAANEFIAGTVLHNCETYAHTLK